MEEAKNFASRDAILAISDVQTEDVFVPEWNLLVRVRGLTGHQRDAWENSLFQIRRKGKTIKTDDFRARLCVLCMVDQQGKRLFGDGDAQALSRKSASALAKVFDVASRLSGLSDEDAEELMGNSETAPGDDSSSD